MILGGRKTTTKKHRLGRPVPAQAALSPSAVARLQEDARLRDAAAYRVQAQQRFDIDGLPKRAGR